MSIRIRVEKIEEAVVPWAWLAPILGEGRTRELQRVTMEGQTDALMARLTDEELEAIIYSGPHSNVIRSLSTEILEAIVDGRIDDTQLRQAIMAGKGDSDAVNAVLLRICNQGAESRGTCVGQ